MKLAEVTESKPFSEKYLPVLKKKLEAAFPELVLNLMPVPGYVQVAHNLPGGTYSMITVTGFQGGLSARLSDRIYNQVLQKIAELIPKNNLMGVEPVILETELGCVIILKQKAPGTD